MKITNNIVEQNMSAAELKKIADEKGITYKKNATAAEMAELLNVKSDKTSDTNETKVEKSNLDTSTEVTDVTSLLKRLNELENMVRNTGDSNKIKDFEKGLKKLNNFSYSIKLFPTDEGEMPVISWKTVSNYVKLGEGDKIEANQIIEITYLDKKGDEGTKRLDLIDFSKFLVRSEKITAKSITNLDGSDVYISKEINPESKLEYYVMKPQEQTFNVTLEYNNQELTILSTYLNA